MYPCYSAIQSINRLINNHLESFRLDLSVSYKVMINLSLLFFMGRRYFLIIGGCVTEWGCIFTTQLTMIGLCFNIITGMGLHSFEVRKSWQVEI